MTELTPSDDNSPPNQPFGRKNKLGYTRISVACSHCRRRKIRCVIEEGAEGGRCSNCIKLERECFFTTVDHPNNAESSSSTTAGLGSRTPSTMSRSPSGFDSDHHQRTDHDSHGTPGAVYAVAPTGPTANPGILASQGMAISPHSATHESFSVNDENVPEWHPSAMGVQLPGYHQPSQYPDQWCEQAQQVHRFVPPVYPQGGHAQQNPYVDQPQLYPARQPQWQQMEQRMDIGHRLGGTVSYVPQHPHMMYNAQFLQSQPTIAMAPVVPSQQFYGPGVDPGVGPGINPGGDMENQQHLWGMYQQALPRTDPSRHDSLATSSNLLRGHPNQDSFVDTEDGPQKRARKRPKNIQEYPE